MATEAEHKPTALRHAIENMFWRVSHVAIAKAQLRASKRRDGEENNAVVLDDGKRRRTLYWISSVAELTYIPLHSRDSGDTSS